MSEYPKIPPYSPQAPPYSPQAPPYSPQAPPYDQGPPPPGFYVPQPQPQPQTTTIHTTTIIQTSQFGETPKRMTCPNCHHEILTAVSTECSMGQHICFFVMCITGICWVCSCLPYCMDFLANVRHTCPNCHAHLGSYNQC